MIIVLSFPWVRNVELEFVPELKKCNLVSGREQKLYKFIKLNIKQTWQKFFHCLDSYEYKIEDNVLSSVHMFN